MRHCHELTQHLCLQRPPPRGLLLTSEGSGAKSTSFKIAVPSAPSPWSFALTHLLNSALTVLKMGGMSEIQLLASVGVPTRPQSPAHTWGPRLDLASALQRGC